MGCPKLDNYYDESGICGMRYNGVDYIFEKNILGDVLGIYNMQTGQKIGEYSYDAWGNILTQTNNDVTNMNPFRYRGYYYDKETGLYYLNSRYYDSDSGRFINADEPSMLFETAGIVGGANLYAYCLNNPVMYTDSTGQFFLFDWVGKGAKAVGNAASAAWNWTTGAVNDAANWIGDNISDIAGWAAVAGLTIGAGALFVFSFGAAAPLSAAMIGASAGIIAGMGLSIYAQGGFANANPWSVAGAGVIGGAIGAAAGFASYYAATLGSWAGQQLGFAIGSMTHLSSGVMIGKIISTTLLMKIGATIGMLGGAYIGGTIANSIANDLYGSRYDNNVYSGIRGLGNIFRWLIRR